jgi:hypothetical protein
MSGQVVGHHAEVLKRQFHFSYRFPVLPGEYPNAVRIKPGGRMVVREISDAVILRDPDAGDVWTWTAIDADTKLMLSWLVGSRDLPSAKAFMQTSRAVWRTACS